MTRKPFTWDRTEARAGKFDGKFIIGVWTTGIYCIPSCSARQPKPENVSIFKTEEEAKDAGLRACKRCRPDLFYKGEDENIALFEGLQARVRGAIQEFPDASALAKACGVSQTKLGELFREHAHLAPAAWLRRERVRAAARMLLGGDERVVDVGYGVGFESESVFHRQFLALARMTPGAYRALRGASVFLLQLPPGYRAAEVLAYHARDPESPTEKSEGNRIWKALLTPDGPAVLEISLEGEVAWGRVHAARKIGPESIAQLHAAALRMLGLNNEIALFEKRVVGNAFFARRKGLRVPAIPTGFDGLSWAIIGQQINVKFAASLRREIIQLAGVDAGGGMVAHPTADRIADLSTAALAKRRFSRSKADYLIGAAKEVAEGRIDIETLPDGSAAAFEKKLKAVRGIGTWTARYAMLRAGFADAAPVGDSALATVLQRLHGLDERPDQDATHKLMLDYAPHRSLATSHLWAALRDAA
ncbi:MAG TPA: Ada metal-binding domain-containing protein [Rhizomicrobium sp.]|jgi:AraC family transcriptional regulator of adaptative response / DNA-3-methyladenine glycosylase II